METLITVVVILALIGVGALLIHRTNVQNGNRMSAESHDDSRPAGGRTIAPGAVGGSPGARGSHLPRTATPESGRIPAVSRPQPGDGPGRIPALRGALLLRAQRLVQRGDRVEHIQHPPRPQGAEDQGVVADQPHPPGPLPYPAMGPAQHPQARAVEEGGRT
ncbi:hypothetical protein SANTM175S_00220 [Streptomyces antimycoticus]